MPDNATTWKLIHAERAGLVDTLSDLAPQQWGTPSLCGGWTVQQTAGHIVAGAEQTPLGFFSGLAVTGFRFNAMVQRDVDRLGGLAPTEIVERLRARTTTTNHPPAPVGAMLGEIVVHGEDIRRPLGLQSKVALEATVGCLDMYKGANFPVGGKKRIAGVRFVATDTNWSHGSGPEVTGPALSLLMVMAGRGAAMKELSGDGLSVLGSRLQPVEPR
jgi:uncharacterized protein (TIGR03083 family)